MVACEVHKGQAFGHFCRGSSSAGCMNGLGEIALWLALEANAKVGLYGLYLAKTLFNVVQDSWFNHKQYCGWSLLIVAARSIAFPVSTA